MMLALGVLLTAEYPVSELVALAQLSETLAYDEVSTYRGLDPAIAMAPPGTE